MLHSANRTVVIAQPRGRYVVGVRIAPMPFGGGSLVYRCGGCGIDLLEGVAEKSLKQIVFHCPVCGAYSEVA